MKELLIGAGIGFVIGAVMCKANKPFSETVEKGVEKGKEIISDIKEEVKDCVNKSKKNAESTK